MISLFAISRYLISKKWVNKWKSYCGIDEKIEEHPGPIDNSNLLESESAKLAVCFYYPALYTMKNILEQTNLHEVC